VISLSSFPKDTSLRMRNTTTHATSPGRLHVDALLTLPSDQISQHDLAEMNLICATGLPGSEDLDISQMLQTLNHWSEQASITTNRSLLRFRADPAQFGGTEAWFRILMLATTLQRQFNVHYNPDRIANPHVWNDARDSFIHGILGPQRAGTCSSLPVLIAAIGRRLGYPLKLALAPGHVFCRWDTPQERFNIEFHPEGLNSHPDEHYKQWPERWSPEMEAQEKRHPTWLLSLSPPEELALFAATRAYCLDAAGRHAEAAVAIRAAHRLAPNHPSYDLWLGRLEAKAMYPDFGVADVVGFAGNSAGNVAPVWPVISYTLPTWVGMPKVDDQSKEGA
jgi:hypothetical protein